MKLPRILVVLPMLVCAASAQNLIKNGDFELNGGSLEEWTSSGVTVVHDGNSNVGRIVTGDLSQTIETVVGEKYYVALDAVPEPGGYTANFTLNAVAANETIDGTRSLPVASFPDGTRRFALTFTANSQGTKIEIVATGFGSGEKPVNLDNVVAYQLQPSNYAGRYVGRVATGITVPDAVLSNKLTTRAVGRVYPNGELIILAGTDRTLSGIVLNDGTFEIGPHNASLTAGKMKARRRLSFVLPDPALRVGDVNGTDVVNAVTRTLNLTRVGR